MSVPTRANLCAVCQSAAGTGAAWQQHATGGDDRVGSAGAGVVDGWTAATAAGRWSW